MSSKKKGRSRTSGTPQKGGSATSSQWVLCHKCDIRLPASELSHSATCSLPDSGYIQHGTLHGSAWQEGLETQATAPPVGWHASLCLLCPDTMLACGLRVSDRIVLTCGDRRAICRAWPASEVPLTAVGVTTGTQSRLAPLDSPPVLTALTGCVRPAQTVEFRSREPAPPFLKNSRFLEKLNAELVGEIVGFRHRIVTTFMGSKVELEVTNVQVTIEDDSIAGEMANLSIANGADGDKSMTNSRFAVAGGDTTLLTSTPRPKPSRSVGELGCGDTPTLVEITWDTRIDVQSGGSEAAVPAVVPPPPRLAGLDQTISYLQSLIEQVFSSWRERRAGTIAGDPLGAPRGVLVFGPSGTGKSALARLLAHRYGPRFHLLRAGEIQSRYRGGSEEQLRQAFELAQRQLPAVLFIDDLQSVAAAGGSERQRRLLACLLALVDGCGEGLALLATTARPADLDPTVRRAGRLDREMELTPPGPGPRAEILTHLLADQPNLSSEQVGAAAAAAHGYVGADLQAVVSEARLLAVQRDPDAPPSVTEADLQLALKHVKPSAMREALVEVPTVRWDDIGGQAELKLRLKQAVEWPIKNPDAFRRLGINPPKGVLMYGPPGCSKTMIAKALATESGLNFISIKGPELFSKWVGESERAVREVFRRARQSAPAVVFVDELDALAVRRGDSASGGHSVGERVLAQLLTEIDGVSALRDVTVVAATNRPDLIDPALLRPGRLDSLVHVPLPSRDTRHQIFTIRLRATPADPDVSADWLADQTDGYSGAEVTAVCHEAALLALERDPNVTSVSLADFRRALQTVQPRVNDYHHVYRKFEQSRTKT